MNDDFHLVDLTSQASAVQRRLRGLSPEEKLAWLAESGRVSQVPKIPEFADTFWFESSIGLKCAFFFWDDRLVLLGDHTTIPVPEERDRAE
jgi:hypothetical protein